MNYESYLNCENWNKPRNKTNFPSKQATENMTPRELRITAWNFAYFQNFIK
jgi:hypothetical protein